MLKCFTVRSFHLGRDHNLVDALVPEVFLLTGYDQSGYGQSPGKRGFIQSWDACCQDIAAFLILADMALLLTVMYLASSLLVPVLLANSSTRDGARISFVIKISTQAIKQFQRF